ncbi:MAG: cbb3-type cytochrome oxidase assembly protein CcoS [Rhodanobacter sp.]|jgi:cbb3-type cytochrome oxidase maturation protein|nr:cbb3-type cytochrome oxidase assembly protein CcoS [Rhodanobacter sp.]
MNIVLVLIPLSIVLLSVGIWAFFWSVNNAQFDDLETPALMPLCDDPPPLAHGDKDASEAENKPQ